jgi:hypothetical protein
MLDNDSYGSLEPIKKDPELNKSGSNSYEMNAYADVDPFQYINVNRYKEILSK